MRTYLPTIILLLLLSSMSFALRRVIYMKLKVMPIKTISQESFGKNEIKEIEVFEEPKILKLKQYSI